MNIELKRILLQRMFTDLKYMGRFARYYIAAMDLSLEAFAKYEEAGGSSREADRWRSIVKPNYEGMRAGIKEAYRLAQEGSLSKMRYYSGDLQSLSRNLDHAGRECFDWWTDKGTRRSAAYCLNNAQRMGSNVDLALGNAWKSPESILKESVTGPVNERELYGYLEDEDKKKYAYDPLKSPNPVTIHTQAGTIPFRSKEVLLKRKFASVDYIKRFCAYYEAVSQIPNAEFAIFKKKTEQDSTMQGQYEVSLRVWPTSVLGFFVPIPAGIWLAFHAYREGYADWLIDLTAEYTKLYFEDWTTEKRRKWWPENCRSRKEFSHARDQVKRDGLNIYKTLRDVWHPGEILNENITGPIDEEELLNYLKPGERLEDLG